MKFSRQTHWGGLPFPPPVRTMTCSSWVALHSMPHSFIELRKPLRHDKTMICEGDGMLQFMVLQRAGHNWVTNNDNVYIYKHKTEEMH